MRNKITNLEKSQPQNFKDMSAASGCKTENGVIVYRFGIYNGNNRLHTVYQKDCVSARRRVMDNRGKRENNTKVNYLLENIYVYTTNTVHFLEI